MTVGSEAWVPNRAVGSGGMGCRGGVVDGGGVVGASGGGDRQTHVYKKTPKQYNKNNIKLNSHVGSYIFQRSKTNWSMAKHYMVMGNKKGQNYDNKIVEIFLKSSNKLLLMQSDALLNMHEFKHQC